MTFPLLLTFFATGIGSAPLLPPLPFPQNLYLILLAGLMWFLLRLGRAGILPLGLCLFLCGVSLCQREIHPAPDAGRISAFVGQAPVAVEGVVMQVSRRPTAGAVVDLETRRVVADGIGTEVKGRIRLFIEDGVPPVQGGDRIRFLSRLRAPTTFGTPGEFDYPRHLAGRGIRVTAWVPQAGDLVVFGSSRPLEPTGRVEAWRERVRRLIESSVQPAAVPLVSALVIGDKSQVSQETRELLGRGGVSHLFAISGLHFGLIAAFLYGAGVVVYRCSTWLLLLAPPRRLLPLLLLPPLLFYLLFTGSAVPTRRAFLVALAGALLLLWRRRTSALSVLATAACLLLLVSPLTFFEPSFQLSFAGVLGRIVLLPRWQPRPDSPPTRLALFRRWTLTLLLATTAATITTSPLVLLHFHLLAPAGLLTNLFAVPGIGLVAVPLGLAGAVTGIIWPAGGGFLLQGCALVIEATLAAVAWVTALPHLGGWKLYLGPPQILGAFLLAAAVLLPGGSRKRLSARLMLLLAALLLGWGGPQAGDRLQITALSVGHGDATLLSWRGEHLLIDGGGLHGERMDVGERLIAPALGRLGVHSLAAVVLTHDHPDHRQGLLHVLEHFSVASFWAPAPIDTLHPTLRQVLERREIPVVLFPPGWSDIRMPQFQGLDLSLLAPGPAGGNLNDESLVIYARLGGEGVLLTGDLEESGVDRLLAAPPPGPVTLLKLPHHGSRRSRPELLLDRFEPQFAFVSAGRGNPRLPSPEVTNDLQARGIPLFRTDRQGSLRFTTDGDGWQPQTWRRGLFR